MSAITCCICCSYCWYFSESMTVTFSILLELQVATVGGIGIETLPPVQVMFGYVLADGHFFESRYRFEVFDLPLQRQVAVAAMFERVF